MDKLGLTFLTILGVAATLVVIVCLSTIFGGIAGWVVGFVFTDTFAVLKSFLGVTCTNFELGGAIGFIGGFFRSLGKK